MRVPQPILNGIQYLAPKERLLVVQTERFTAGAVFQKVDSLWYCIEAGPDVRWMLGRAPQEIRDRLSKMRARWQFFANADAEQEGVDQMTSQREARGALTRQTTGELDHNKLPDGPARLPSPQEEAYPDLKGVKPLDTARGAVVTSTPTVSRESEGVPPSCPCSVLETSHSE